MTKRFNSVTEFLNYVKEGSKEVVTIKLDFNSELVTGEIINKLETYRDCENQNQGYDIVEVAVDKLENLVVIMGDNKRYVPYEIEQGFVTIWQLEEPIQDIKTKGDIIL
jgi:hypothetical protein